jgi:hypothetical protein
VHWAPGIPRALCSARGEKSKHSSGAIAPRDMKTCFAKDVSDGIDKPRNCRHMRRMIRQLFNLHLDFLDFCILQALAGHARFVI